MRTRFNILSLLVILVILSGCAPKVDAPLKDVTDDTQSMMIEEETSIDDTKRVVERLSEGVESLKDKVNLDDYKADWSYYEDKNIGISVQYPQNVSMDDISSLFKLRLEVEKVADLEGTLGFDKETATKNIKALNIGKYGEDVDFPLEASKKVRSVLGTSAQEFMVLSRFEICSTIFERKLYLFNNNYQILLTLTADSKAIIAAAPDYFDLNKENCGDEKIWNFEKQEAFYSDLIDKKDLGVATQWFNIFDEIVDTLSLTKDRIEENQIDKSVQIANPASVFCEENGGRLKIETNKLGEGGICYFDDNSSCEEWAFFRGECETGGQ